MIFLLTAMLSFGQDYKLFHAGSQKLYVKDSSIIYTCALSFDSANSSGTDSIYYGYTSIDFSNYMQSDSCMFWGGPYCNPQNEPTGFGKSIIYNNNGLYHFITREDDTLRFDFSIQNGDTSLIYQDSIQKLSMVFMGSDTATVLSMPDSLRYYALLHTDNAGNPISSPLHNHILSVGKALGMLNFFRTDQFPAVQQYLKLVGQVAPEIGMTKLSYEKVFDYQVGDEFQYLESNTVSGGPPWMNSRRYIKHLILSRTDSQDSIVYSVRRSVFDPDSTYLNTDTIPLAYLRNGLVAEFPFDKIDQTQYLQEIRLFKEDYCGLNLWTYTISPRYLAYCPADNCWGSFDTQGPPPMGTIQYVSGLGLYKQENYMISPPPGGYSQFFGIVYFKKNGMVCGDEAVLRVPEPENPASLFEVYPNPMRDELFVRSAISPKGNITVCNIFGQVVLTTAITGTTTKINTSDLPAGSYLVRIASRVGLTVKKIVK